MANPKAHAPTAPALLVLGGIELAVDGPSRLERSARLRQLLAALIISRNRMISADRLGEILWETPPANPVGAIYTLISRLRSVLAAIPDLAIDTNPPGYRLTAPGNLIDATLFDQYLDSAKAEKDPSEAMALIEHALSLWRGDAYAEFAHEDFARAEAARLNGRRQHARELRIDLLLAAGRHEEAIGELKGMISEDQFRERPWEQLMLALHRAGRTAEALKAFRTFSTIMDDELGLRPGPSLVELHLRLLKQDPSALPTAATVARQPREEVRRDELASKITPEPPPAHGHVRHGLRLIGRAADIDAIAGIMEDQPLLTITGPGGVGKTQLAKNVLDAVRGRYADDTYVCELAAVNEPDQVADVVASAVGAQPAAGHSPLEQVRARLRGRCAIVLLDNCEHVLSSVAATVQSILSDNPAVRVLATSRVRIGTHYEQVWQVDPLPVPHSDEDFEADSVRLFIERARLVNRSFEPSANLPALCRRLDGLPLAIELAAARMQSMTVQDVLDQLDDNPRVLESRLRPVAKRHRSLHAVVDWSYNLLDPLEQSVFAQLSVFPESFTLEAAAAVVEADLDEAEIGAVVLDLVERSLLKRSEHLGRSRYSLLDTLRSYGRRQLGPESLNDAAMRHARWFLDLACDLGHGCGAGNSDWLRKLDVELPNLRAAHRRMCSSGDIDGVLALTEALHYFAISTLSIEVYEWAEEAIHIAKDSRSTLLPAAYASSAVARFLASDFDGALRRAERGINIAEESGSDCARYALVARGDVEMHRERFDTALEYYRRAELVAERAGARLHRTLALGLQGSCLTRLGRTDEAAALIRLALHEADRAESPDLQAKIRVYAAELALVADPSGALGEFRDAEQFAVRAGGIYGQHQIQLARAWTQCMHGQPDPAADGFRRLLVGGTGLLRDNLLTCVLQGVMVLLAKQGWHDAAAILSGAIPVDAKSLANYTSMECVTQFSDSVAGLRAVLGAKPFRADQEMGRRFSLSQAKGFALAALDTAGLGVRADG